MWRYQTSREFFVFEPQIAWIPIQKAANTAVKHRLYELGVFALESLEADKVEKDTQAIHGALRHSRFQRTPRDLSAVVKSGNSFSFVIVRSPQERLESFYRDKVIGSGWSPGAVANFEKVYGVRHGDTWPSFLEKVLSVPAKYQNPHLRSMKETFRGAGLSHTAFKLYPSSRLDRWDQDLLSYLKNTGFYGMVPVKSGVAVKNASREYKDSFDWFLPPRLAKAYELLYKWDESICDIVENRFVSR